MDSAFHTPACHGSQTQFTRCDLNTHSLLCRALFCSVGSLHHYSPHTEMTWKKWNTTVATDAAGPIHILGSVGHLSSWLKGKDLATRRNDFPLPFTSFHWIDWPHPSLIGRKQIKFIDVSIIWCPHWKGMKEGGETLHGGNWSWRALFWGGDIVLSCFCKFSVFPETSGSYCHMCPLPVCSAWPQDCCNGKGNRGGKRQKPSSLLETVSHCFSQVLVTLRETKPYTSLVGLVGLVWGFSTDF